MGRMSITATVQGHEGKFMLDMGAGAEMVSTRFAANLKLSPSGYFTGYRMTGQRVEGQRFSGAPVAIGVLNSARDIGVSDHLDQDPIDGLISARVFENTPVTLDFAGKEVVVETPATLRQRSTNGRAVPLKLSDDRGMRLDLFAEFNLGNGQTGLCEVDTGFFGIVINKRYMEALKIAPDTAGVEKIEFSPGFSTYKTHLPVISLVAAPDEKLENPLVNFGDFVYDCVVGMRFWKSRTVTLDIPSRQLIVGRRVESAKGSAGGTD